MQKGSDEIDLMELLARGYRGIKNNILLFITLPLAGISIALLIFYITGESYASSMMVTTDLISASESKFISEELDNESTMLGLTLDEAKKVKSITFKIEKEAPPLTKLEIREYREYVFFAITAEVSDPAIFPILEKKILVYLDSLEPVIEKREREKSLNLRMIEKIDQEIAMMDNIKTHVDSKVITSSTDPSNLFAKAVELFQDRTEREIRLKEIESVHLTKGFSSLIKDAKIAKSVYVAIGFVGGMVVFVLIMFVRFFNRYNLEFEEA
jgi:hypothetical protein